MSSRWHSIFVGVFGGYLLAHAAVLGYAALGLWDVLRQISPSGDLITTEMHEMYISLIAGSLVFSAFGALTISASVGLGRGSNWGRRLWLGTSVALVMCVVLAVTVLEVTWTRYVYELAMVAGSWWCMATLASRARVA